MTGAPDQQQAGQGEVNPGPEDRLLFQIQTFTARYDPAEDRLRLDAIDAKGRKQALLLTRRLADRIIPVLVSHLEGKTPEGISADLAQGGSCRECCGNSLAARSGHVKGRCFRLRGQGAWVRGAERGFPSRRPFASGSARRRAAPIAASARSRRRATRSGS